MRTCVIIIIIIIIYENSVTGMERIVQWNFVLDRIDDYIILALFLMLNGDPEPGANT